MKLSTKVAALTELVMPAVQSCGVELWGIEFMPQGRKSLLRIYIECTPSDKQNGQHITIEDCSAVTHQVSGVLEVHDPIAGEYVLEVSSPGFDRPFFRPEQIVDYVGQTVLLRLIDSIGDESERRRKVQGVLTQTSDDGLTVRTSDGQEYEVLFDNIDKANLVYQE